MRILPYTLILLFGFILTSCGPDYGPKKVHPSEISHDYEQPTKKPTDKLDELGKEAAIEKEELYTLYRDLWQNPIEVINRMGDLEDKVIADIGAGPYGYFSMMIASRTSAKKVIAIDIDPEAIQFMNDAKKLLPDSIQNRIETRLVSPVNPNLEASEADIILIVNTAIYFDNRIQYFENLLSGLSKNGKLVVIDFKLRNTPVGPPLDQRIALGRMESDLIKAGYKNIDSDDRSLEYQYIIIASK